VLDLQVPGRDRSLEPLAVALTDSLRRLAQRRPGTELSSPERLRELARGRGDVESVAREAGVDVVLRGLLAAHGDSVRLTLFLHDASAGRFGKSLQASAPRSEAATLSARISASLAGWLGERQDQLRSTRSFNFPPGTDSAFQAARRLRDSISWARRQRPDSIPPTA